MKNFLQNRKYIENEFENATFDRSTGLDANILFESLKKIQETNVDEPRQIVCAKAYSYLLDNVQLQINAHTPFAVKINTGVDYSYFASADIFANALFYTQRDKILKEKLPYEFNRGTENHSVGFGDHPHTDFWHTVPNWTFLVEQGFSGILKKANKSKETLLKSGDYEESQIVFLESVIICYKAILRLLERIYDYSLRFDIPDFSNCIKNLISNPPRSLYEIMQFSILYLYFEEIGVERARTLGPIDRLYYPYFRKALDSGTALEEIKELYRYFFIHFTASKRYAQQPFTMCGSDAQGKDLTNELSFIMLEVYDALNIYDPKIHIRYHKNLDEAILLKALSMIRKGNSSICIINDDAVLRGYEKIGIPRSEACDYVILGCYEPIIMGKEEGEIAPDRLNMLKCVEFALNGGKDILTDKQIGYISPLIVSNFDEFYDIFINQLDYALDFDLDYIQKQEKFNTLINPSPIYSSSFCECIEKGMDVHEFPLKYNNLSLKPFALASTVDSLVAIKKYVFEKKLVSLEEMRLALKANWQGYEWLQKEIIKDKEKYGNNLPVPDELMTRITKHISERYLKQTLQRGGAIRLGLDSISLCVDCADKIGASPDGRNKGNPISKNLCASDGMDRGGITAYMQSVLKIDSADYLDATILDFVLHPSTVEGEKGLCDFKSLIEVFFKHGGFAIQGNIFNGDSLREAQTNPEKYATLQVRVCGWNEYFIKLNKETQNMFIKQCEVSS